MVDDAAFAQKFLKVLELRSRSLGLTGMLKTEDGSVPVLSSTNIDMNLRLSPALMGSHVAAFQVALMSQEMSLADYCRVLLAAYKCNEENQVQSIVSLRLEDILVEIYRYVGNSQRHFVFEARNCQVLGDCIEALRGNDYKAPGL